MSDDVLAPFEAEADKAQEFYERDAKAIATDANLSAAGKAQRMGEAEARRRAAAEGIQLRAVDAVADRTAAATQELATLLAAEAKAERGLLAEANPTMFLLLEREVAEMDDPELVDFVESSRDPVEWELRGRLVDLEFKRRQKAKPTEARQREANKLLRLKQPPNPKVRALRDELAGLGNVTWQINALNRKAYADEMRAKLGFGPAPL